MFARKYGTSCATCHVMVPKLNNFGIAFRNNGFEWPGGEAEMSDEKPVVLAAPANRESFPNSLWPSWLPRSFPLAAVFESELYISRRYEKYVSPEGLGADLDLELTGAIAEGIAVDGDLSLRFDPKTKSVNVGADQAFMQFRLYKQLLDLRVGRLYPGVFSFPFQTLGPNLWLYERTTGSSSWSMKGRLGLELRSILAGGRLRAVAGGSGSEGDLGNDFDGWARVGAKIGGMSYSGSPGGRSEAASSSDPSRPWRDDSIQLGAFGYLGSSKFPGAGDTPVTLQDRFFHLGLDFNAWLHDLNVFGAFVAGRHTQLTQDVGLGSRWIYLALVQADYVLYPWLVGSLRFEWSDDARYLTYSMDHPRWHLMPGLSALIRANVKAYVFGELGPDETGALSFFTVTIGLFSAF